MHATEACQSKHKPVKCMMILRVGLGQVWLRLNRTVPALGQTCSRSPLCSLWVKWWHSLTGMLNILLGALNLTITTTTAVANILTVFLKCCIAGENRRMFLVLIYNCGTMSCSSALPPALPTGDMFFRVKMADLQEWLGLTDWLTFLTGGACVRIPVRQKEREKKTERAPRRPSPCSRMHSKSEGYGWTPLFACDQRWRPRNVFPLLVHLRTLHDIIPPKHLHMLIWPLERSGRLNETQLDMPLFETSEYGDNACLRLVKEGWAPKAAYYEWNYFASHE